jgi:hypothetical protein
MKMNIAKFCTLSCLLHLFAIASADHHDDETFYRQSAQIGSLGSKRTESKDQTPVDDDRSPTKTEKSNLSATKKQKKTFKSLRTQTKSKKDFAIAVAQVHENDDPPKRRSEEQREALRSCVRWGVGLEHESMLVHRKEGGLEEYVVDAGRVLREMSVYGPVHGLSRELHEYAIQTYQDGAGRYSAS